MKRLVGVVVGTVTLAVLSAGSASAQQGAPGFEIKERAERVKAEGPGFEVKLAPDQLKAKIDDESFGIPEAGFPIQRAQLTLGPNPNRRPFVCENGTYRILHATFSITQRGSSTEPRPAPYTPAFNAAFPNVFTFVGMFDGAVTDQDGEQFRLVMTDLAHEVLTEDSFSSTNPIHAYFVDSEGRVRDRAALVGRVNINRTTGEAWHQILDSGTCHQAANLNLGPSTDQATVFGPFFVLPFNTTVVMP